MIQSQLTQRGESQVSIIVIKEEAQGEVEIALQGGYRVSPQIASAMRAVPGVVEVELVVLIASALARIARPVGRAALAAPGWPWILKTPSRRYDAATSAGCPSACAAG